jgi:predicted SprT family Zn-dependent metalloprotease
VKRAHFGGVIPTPTFRISRRMTRTAGCVFLDDWEMVLSGPYFDRYGWGNELVATIKHECIHLYLAHVQHPSGSGHTKEFRTIAQRIGATLRSMPMPRSRPRYRYLIACLHCQDRWVRGRWNPHHACAACCDRYNEGRYSPDYPLTLIERQRVQI